MLDLNEVITTILNTLSKSGKKFTRDDRSHLTKVVGTMFDEHITTQMFWTKRHVDFDPGRYLEMLGDLVTGLKDQYQLIEDIQESFDRLMIPVIDLPTWRIIWVRTRGSNVQLELGEDYRIKDWMAKHAKEYRAPAEERTW